MRTKEDLKQDIPMTAIVERYGFHPRAGFIHCPFHQGDSGASLKVYSDSFYCFGCGAYGDIFDFVMRMEDISFKEAFLWLGGEYEKPDDHSSGFARAYASYKRQKEREDKQVREARERARIELNGALIDAYRKHLNKAEPMSEAWTELYNSLQMELVRHSCLTGVPYDVEVIRLE